MMPIERVFRVKFDCFALGDLRSMKIPFLYLRDSKTLPVIRGMRA